jgi:hypothetical protein
VKRRDFITLLGGAAATWPLVAHAEQRERTRRIGALMSQSADDRVAQTRYAAFLQGLQRSGWEVGRNVKRAVAASSFAHLDRSRYKLGGSGGRSKEKVYASSRGLMEFLSIEKSTSIMEASLPSMKLPANLISASLGAPIAGQLYAKHNHSDDLSSDVGRSQGFCA